MLPCACSVKDQRRRQNAVGTSVTAVVTRLTACVSLLVFLPHAVICDTLLNICSETQNLFAKHAGTGKNDIIYVNPCTLDIQVVNGKPLNKSFSCTITQSFS